MMKRLLLPGYLFFFLCICLCVITPAHAQDTTKKVETEKKAEPEKAVVKTVIPPKVKPVYHYHKVNPAATPATPINNDSTNLNAQVDATQLTDKSLNGQYQYLLTKVYRYQQPLIGALWKNVTDTLTLTRNQLKDVQTKLAAQTQTLNSLKADLNAAKQTEPETTSKSDTISFFGLIMSKSTYNLVMVGLVIGLAVALIVVILTTAKYKHDAKHSIEMQEELEEEFKTYKAKATEKELKLARELQTERNKLDELLGRG